jgi:hypothetical protein
MKTRKGEIFWGVIGGALYAYLLLYPFPAVGEPLRKMAVASGSKLMLYFWYYPVVALQALALILILYTGVCRYVLPELRGDLRKMGGQLPPYLTFEQKKPWWRYSGILFLISLVVTQFILLRIRLLDLAPRQGVEHWAFTYFGVSSPILGAVVVAQWIVLFILIRKLLVLAAIHAIGPPRSTALAVTAVVVGGQAFARHDILLMSTGAVLVWIWDPMFRWAPRGFGKWLVPHDVGEIVTFAVLAAIGAAAIRLVNRWAREAD